MVEQHTTALRYPHKLRDLQGYKLRARDGEIGKLDEVYFDDKHWALRYFVVRTGGWLSGGKVLIAPAAVTGVDDDGHHIDVDLNREHIENSPPVESQVPVSRHYEQEFYRYYGWQPYWINDPLLPPVPSAPPPAAKAQPPANPHLRSSEAVKGYRIHAEDGEIGHVEDLILEAPDWIVRYVEVDTRNWLPSKHVLLDTAWLHNIDWLKQEVVVDLKRDAIKTAPAYDASKLISRDYQVALYEHYGKEYQRSEVTRN